MLWCKKKQSAIDQNIWCSINCRIDYKGAKFPRLVDTRGEARGLQFEVYEKVRVLGLPPDHFTQSVRSLAGTRVCDQPLQNLQRIHYHVSGCSTSRDHVPILYDILYWSGRSVGGGGRVVLRSFTEAEVRGRTGSLLRSESLLQGARLCSLCLGAQCLVWKNGEEPGRFEFNILIIAGLLSSVNWDYIWNIFCLLCLLSF